MGLTPTTLESLTEAVTQDHSYVNTAMWQSLHSADPGTTGTSEITTGTGPAGRQQVTYSGSAGTDVNTLAVDYTVAGSNTVRWIGYWTAQTGGTFIGGFPLVGPVLPAMSEASGPVITCPAHGFTAGDPVRLYPIPGIDSSAVPSGFTEDSTYYVVGTPTTDAFDLSATVGGSAINAGATLGFQVAPDRSQAFAVEGTLGFPATSGIAYETAS